MKIRIASEEELGAGARALLEALGDRRHIALEGAMGAGKTTLTAAIGRELGVTDDVTSPTFSIVNEYETEGGQLLYHFDFYRIEDETQALELGLEDYFESGALCIMEWAGNVDRLLPDDTTVVNITVDADGGRTLEFDLSKCSI